MDQIISPVPPQAPRRNWLLLALIGILVFGTGVGSGLLIGKLIYRSVPTPSDLFKYINKVENSKLQNAELEAWRVEINTNLLTDKNIKKFRINLFDGHNYEVERNEEQMQNSTCESQQCTWIGYISGRYCIAKDTVTGSCSPGESIIFVLNNDAITGNIPAVTGVNQYAYSIGGMTNDPGPFLIKIDPSKFGPD